MNCQYHQNTLSGGGKNPSLEPQFMPPLLTGKGNDYRHILERASLFQASGQSYSQTVSIIIPAYNRCQLLANTLAALTHQTYPAHLTEIIVVDDGSDDAIFAVIKKYESRLNLYYARQADAGYQLSAARNIGVRFATGDAIVIMDADILPLEQDIENYMRVLHVTDNAILLGHRKYVNSSGITDDAILENIETAKQLPSIQPDNDVAPANKNQEGDIVDWRFSAYEKTNYLIDDLWPFHKVVGATFALPRSLLDKAGYFDEEFNAWGCEDNEFGYRLYNEGAYFIPMLDVLALHQEPLDGIVKTDSQNYRKMGFDKMRLVRSRKSPAPIHRLYLPGEKFDIPKVSLYIPAYNAATYIVDAVQSCLKQNFEDMEVVVCDDGSTDNTLELLEKHFTQNPKVRWVAQQHGGIGSAINTAMQMCRGMYIGQLDAEDLLKPDAVRECVKVLDGQLVDAVYTDYEYIDGQGKYIRDSITRELFSRELIMRGIDVGRFGMFRKRLWARTNGANELLPHVATFELWMKLSRHGEIAHIHQTLCSVRWHGDNNPITLLSNQQIQDAYLNSSDSPQALLQSGLQAFKDKQYLLALQCYMRVLQQPQATPNERIRAYQEAINTSKKADWPVDADWWIERFERAYPDNVQAILQQAGILQKQRKWQESLDKYLHLLGVSPDNLWGLVCGGQCLMELGESERAKEFYAKALGLNPDVANIYVMASASLKKQGHLEAAETWVNRGLELFPENAQLLLGSADLFRQRKDWDNALARLDKLLEHYPYDKSGLLKKADTLQQLANLCRQTGQHEKALEYLKRALSLSVNPVLLFEQGNVLVHLGQFDEAEAAYQRLSQEFPDSVKGIIGLVNLDTIHKRDEEALRKLDRALACFPDEAELYLRKLHLLTLQQNYDACQYMLEIAREKFPDNARIKFAEAQQCKRNFDFQRAAGLYQELLADDPMDTGVNFAYVDCLVQMGKLDEAKAILLELSANPQCILNPRFIDLCAYALDRSDIKSWKVMADTMLDTHLSRPFAVKYINLLQDKGLVRQALDFIEAMKEKAQPVDLRLYITSLFEQQRLENTLLLESSGHSANLERQFELSEARVHALISETVCNHPDAAVREWYALNRKLLETIRTAYQGYYMATNAIPAEALAIARRIIGCIQQKQPFSMLRLGDGEGRFFDYDEAMQPFQEQDQVHIQKLWWGEDLRIQHQAEVMAHYRRAVENADIIGIPDYQCLLTIVNIDTVGEVMDTPAGRGARGYLMVNRYLAAKAGDDGFRNKTITSSFIHHHLQMWGLYDLIFSHLDSCSVVTCHQGIGTYLQDRFSLDVRSVYAIPAEHKYTEMMGHERQTRHYPEVYEALCESITVAYPGEVFLVAAGFLGKIYCNLIKEKGGIALDIGSTVDYWLSFETRNAMFVLDNRNRLSLFYQYLGQGTSLQHFYGTLPEVGTDDGELIHYWINLDRDVERRVCTERQFARLGMANQRVSGITPDRLPTIIGPVSGNYNLKPAEYGCLCAHLLAMQLGIERGQDYFVVQEDDVIIPHSLNIPALLATAPADWEILQLHTINADAVDDLSRLYRTGECWAQWQKKHMGTAMYVINKTAAQKILTDFYGNNGLDVSACEFKPVADLLIYTHVRTYTLTFPVLITEDFTSNIHLNHLMQHQESSRVVKKIHLLPGKYFGEKGRI
jgi:glycosyltransferase involved in cell wall biosynthesis/predicted Zn-dependent protease/GR25 family glycosyltransferase involved in LPS biosynthesis